MHPPSRRPWWTALTLLGAGLVSVSPAEAQIEPGRVYAAGEIVSDPSVGLTLTIPHGWRGALAPDGQTFLLERTAGVGLMIVAGDQATEAEARAQLAAPVPLGNGVVLSPAGEIEQIAAGHLSTPFDVSGGATADLRGRVDVRLTDTGLAIAFMLITPAAEYDERVGDLRGLALSLGVTEPATPPEAAGGSDDWDPFLRGAYLARFYTASGYTESTELWLCTDGTFRFNDQAGGYGPGASGAYQNANAGRWSATGTGATGTLTLEWANGERSTWSLEYDYDQGRTYVNGDRWLRGENERCG